LAFVPFKQEDVEQSIPDRFEQQVSRFPDRPAISARSHRLTYEELNQAANRVARSILAKDEKGEKPTALLLEHGGPVITAMLGLLKAGKCYVSLDPLLPHVRNTSILEDSQAGFVITDDKNLDLAKRLAEKQSMVINLDQIDSCVSAENLGLPMSPDTPSYIIYTSGSTGCPMGVVQNHRNVLHQAMRMTNAFHIRAEDRLTLLASCSTGQAMTNIYNALLNGAELFPFNIREEGLAHLGAWLIQKEITIYHSSATVFRYFVDTLTGEEGFPRLRLIKLGSEPVSARDLESYREHFSQGCIFVNALSSTETGTVCAYFFNKKTPISESTVPVGYAVEDMEIFVLDEDGEVEAAFNHVGQIAVKSLYVSPGYWQRPDLSEAKFLPDPSGGDKRIYLTGDLGRMMPDGCLVHTGRKDFQVKIRGYRVEVREIEKALLGFSAIKQAIVVGREDRPGDQRLVAYLVPNRQPAPSVSELRRFLGDQLPDYMLPSAFVILDTLPLSLSGKVDRHALPAPGKMRPELQATFVAPRTPVEESLAEIWKELLCLHTVGIHDNFLELGGNSLVATQIVSRVLDTFQLELPLRSLFDEASTIADTAVVITQNLAEMAGHEEMDCMLAELEGLSEEEVRARLNDER
jgi:amino acid adenylation domain-containing protein